MDLNILFENIGSIATSLERIADSLEQRGSNTISVSATTATVEDKPKRARRTKAEIEADNKGIALESGELIPAANIPAPTFTGSVVMPAAPAPVIVPPVAAPASVIVPPAPVAAPVAAPIAPAPVAAPAPIAPAPVAAPIGAPSIDTAYLGYAVEHQFAELNKLVAPYFTTYGQVRDAVLSEAAKHGLGVPFSDEADRSQPGAAYRSVSNEARFAIYVAGKTAIAGLGL
jgi:hypothetical protein